MFVMNCLTHQEEIAIIVKVIVLNHRVIQTAYVNGMMMNVKIGTTMMTTMIIAKFTMMTLKAVPMTLDASLIMTTMNMSVMRTKITTTVTAIMAMVIQETEAHQVKIQTMMDKMMMSIPMMIMMELATNKTRSLTIQTSMRIPMVTE